MRTLLVVLRDAYVRFTDEGGMFFAQAFAFNALFTALPLALVSTAVLSFFLPVSGAARVLDAVDTYVPELHDVVAANLKVVVQYRGLAGIIGLGGLIWGGKNFFQSLAYSLNRSLGLPSRHVVWDVAVAIVLVPVSGVALLVATVVPPLISIVVRVAGLDSLRAIPEALTYLTSFGLVFVTAALLYGYLPNRPWNFRFGIPGAAVAALGYLLLQVGFAVYTTHTNVTQIYGTLAAVFAALLWLYYIGVVFLFGAQVSAAWERRAATRAERAA